MFFLKYRYVVINFSSMLLSNTFGNPYNITAFLLLQFQVRKEYSKVKLLQKSHHIQLDLEIIIKGVFFLTKHFYLVFKKLILQCLVSGIVTGAFKQLRILSVILSYSLNLLVVFSPGKSSQTIGIQFTATRVKFCAIIFAQFCAK